MDLLHLGQRRGNQSSLDENPAVNREPNHIPGFLFPSQIA